MEYLTGHSGGCRNEHVEYAWDGRCWMLALLLCFMAPAVIAEDTSVRISGSSWVHDAPTRVAYEGGYFEAAGLSVEVTFEASGQASLARLMDGEVEFALAAGTPVAKALMEHVEPGQSRPDDILVLATVSLSNQTHSIIANRERGIAVPSDLQGKRLGLLKGTSGEYFWTLFAPMHGLQPDSVEMVPVPKAEMVRSLEDGIVDAVVTWDPWIFWIERDVGVNTVTFSERQIYTLDWMIVTRREVLEHYPGAAERILKGYVNAIDDMHQSPGLIEYFFDTDDLPPDYLREIEEKVIYNVSFNWALLTGLEKQLEWLSHEADDFHGRRPMPEQYLEPRPILAVAPDRMLLPDIWAYGEERRRAP